MRITNKMLTKIGGFFALIMTMIVLMTLFKGKPEKAIFKTDCASTPVSTIVAKVYDLGVEDGIDEGFDEGFEAAIQEIAEES